MWTVFTQGNYICMESLNTDPSKVTSGKRSWQRWIGKKSAESPQLIAAFVSFLANVAGVKSSAFRSCPRN